ncbi:D-alanyl-D-alanine carboxypeptidase [Bosea sp. 62]|uniref:D-alanyl-D-alanine carboxypeptidase n=1 Tax=unclassified Bosea (in: a-proteobacteria) TaxID=2653178 RepID=UPI001258D686|nr:MULTISPECIES: D-alanyl-D-alanine carboxypeptidase [unclassified Bosea (in: a-proteobacteria)]CAD5254773.1 D-alanyl-D-alanine carboxypeptidase [Bosea sp. 46]CAD5266547.1 D-alanyl-D-alanine carboxypeptidase [Bosea sp. 21B]CAD5272803.1 D-alanyl-D-alanine carboxypeptidase [Bosea sp. 7B]VVT56047.1 D-alanyl-D-alanine carboxypeptidase [Bosea sp. EC-HK365B]VXB81131.1 D-alanyl-D-alanine carboxypeptidase [Bosea sp. 29B]
MASGCVGSRRGRWLAFIGVVSIAAVALTATVSPAEAARKKRRHVSGGYAPPYAAMVVDAKSGRTLHAVNEDAPRIPASLTKVMTLYMLFEQMERGRFTMNSELKVSAYAASQPPTKLGLRAGSTIEVEDAIKSMITLSANDSSVVVAENIAGSEEAFAEQMTRKARSLGMDSTRFYNPHGLPNSPPNITTARDLTILARAIQERFPRYFPLFQTRSFQYGSRTIRGHNRLLGRIEGVDGIKTGYTRASGFNLMTSAKSEGRQIVSIVLGGRSGASRDKIMSDLVLASLPRASTGGRSAPMIAEATEPQQERYRAPAPAPVPEPPARPALVAQAPEPTPAPIPVPRPRAEPDVPAAARAYAATTTTAQMPPPRALSGSAQALALSNMRPVAATTTPSAMRWSIGAAPAEGKVLRPPANVDTTSSIAKLAEPAARDEVQPMPKKVEARLPEPAPAQAKVAHVAKAPEAKAEAKLPEKTAIASKWVIQLGATDDEAKAKDILSRARAKASGSLADASAFTEKVEKGGATLFRARFAGFEESKDAEKACAQLKRGGFSCFATRG